MKAVILVGGEGTRLRPLTWHTPKAMVPILNRPFLEHLLRYLKKHGVTDIILAMGYLPERINRYFGDGSQFGVHITYLMEESPLGTAGAVKHAEQFLDGPFVVFNGDILTEIDLTAMLKQHQAIAPKASIALTPVDNPTLYGVVETDDQGIVRRFVEKPSRDKITSNMINAGVYILEPEVLAHIPASVKFMFEYHLFPALLEMGEPILSYSSDAYWMDIGTPQKYLKAHHDLLVSWGPSHILTEGESQVHPTARIEGPVLIGEGCAISAEAYVKGPTAIGSRCKIGKGVVVEGSVLWDGAQVEDGVALKNCVVGFRDGVPKEYCVIFDNTPGDSAT